jgi:hypothetical protein
MQRYVSGLGPQSSFFGRFCYSLSGRNHYRNSGRSIRAAGSRGSGSVVDRVGVEAQTPVAINGWFELKTPPGLAADAKVVITAAGFRTVEIIGGRH